MAISCRSSSCQDAASSLLCSAQQRVGDLLGHVGFIIFREDGVGAEKAGSVERAVGNDALSFAKQIGQKSIVGYRQSRSFVGDAEGYEQIVAV